MEQNIGQDNYSQPVPKQSRQIPSWIGFVIIIAFAVIVSGGVFAYQYFFIPGEKNNIETPTDQTAGWKTYTNNEYGFEFKYPEDLFSDFYGSDSDKCSNPHPDNQKYSNRFIFEADQKGIASESISMNITIICTKLEKNKIGYFI